MQWAKRTKFLVIGIVLLFVSVSLSVAGIHANTGRNFNNSSVMSFFPAVVNSRINSFSINSISTYEVTFSESGLLSNNGVGVVPWSVTIDGETLWSTTQTIIFHVPNGTYHYQVSKTASAAGYTPNPESGNITVDGYDKGVSITYTENGNAKGFGNGKYNVSVTLSTDNFITNANGITVLILTNQYNTYLKDISSGITTISGVLNGTYLLYVGYGTSGINYCLPIQSIGYSQIPEPQVVIVNGSSVSVLANFSKIEISKYNITFTESGLSSGTSWSVTLNGSTESSTTSTITFTELNGTYQYTVLSVAGYTVSPFSGSITVSGGNVPASIIFTSVKNKVSKYAITFTESGLSSGTSWSVTLNGSTESSTTSTITFTELNGTYSYTVSNVSGYSVLPSSGSIKVSGSNVSVSITYNPTSPSKTPSSGMSNIEIYVIIGAVVAIAVVGSAIALIRKRK